MNHGIEDKKNFQAGLLILLLALIFLPWAIVQYPQALHSDIIWLCEALQRFLAGERLYDHFQEINPPLSIFTYAGPVILHNISAIPLHDLVYFQSLLLSVLSSLAVYALLIRWHFVKDNAVVAAVAFLLMSTLITSTLFGERDHYVALALAPFVLGQIALTFRLPVSRPLLWAVFTAGAVVILLKPHHGLIPTLLILHRWIYRKRILSFEDKDFFCLAFASAAYIAALLTIFHDYTFKVFPDFIHLYIGQENSTTIWDVSLPMTAALIISVLIASYFIQIEEKKRLICFFLACAFISLILYFIQGTGYYYHLFPCLAFFGIAVSVILHEVLKREISAKWARLVSILMLSGFAYAAATPNPDYPTHKHHQNFPILRLVEKECGEDPRCSFFMFNNSLGVTHETAYYSGIKHGSRFPSFWFLPRLISAIDKSSLSGERKKEYFEKYARMVAQDFEYYKPKLAFILLDETPEKPDFDFVDFFRRSAEFEDQWRHYKKAGILEAPYGDYFSGTSADNGYIARFQVYERIDP